MNKSFLLAALATILLLVTSCALLPLDAPAKITVVVVNNQPVVSWLASSGATTYYVDRNDAGVWTNIATVGNGAILYVDDSTLTDGATYQYRVSAMASGSAQSAWTTSDPLVYSAASAASTGLAPPTWLLGTWKNAASANTYTFTADDVVVTSAGLFTTDFKTNNTTFSGTPSLCYSETTNTANSYVVSGPAAYTYTFTNDGNGTTITVSIKTLTTVTETATKQP